MSGGGVCRVPGKEGICLNMRRSLRIGKNPGFARTAAAGLRLSPPEGSIVMSRNGMPGIQAPGMPGMSARKAERLSF